MNELDKIIQEYKKADIFISDQEQEKRTAEFIYTSNRMEGNKLDYAETISVIQNKINISSGASLTDILEVKGHLKAVKTCIQMAKNLYPLTELSIKNFNRNLLSSLWKDDETYLNWKEVGQQPGEYKVKKNKIECVYNGEKSTIIPPSDEKNVKENMEEVFNQNSEYKSLTESCAHLAFQIFLNQPFCDGNKRTARLAVAYKLIQAGLPLIIFKHEGRNFNSALLDCYFKKTLDPMVKYLEKEIKQQLAQLIEEKKKLDKGSKLPKPGKGRVMIF